MKLKRFCSFLSFFLAFVMILSTVGCAEALGEGGNPPSDGNAPSEDTTSFDETTSEITTSEETTEEITTAEETTAEETTEETTAAVPDDFILSGFGTNPYAYTVTVDYSKYGYDGPQLTEEQLQLDTQALIDLIFSPEYYKVYEYMLYMTIATGMKYMFCETNQAYYPDPYYCYCRDFNGFLELETRPDAARLLLNKYKTSMTDDCLGEYMYYVGVSRYPSNFHSLPILPFLLEVLLARTAIFSQLTEAEQRELYDTICIVRYDPMKPRPSQYNYELDAVCLFFPHYDPDRYERTGKKTGWRFAN